MATSSPSMLRSSNEQNSTTKETEIMSLEVLNGLKEKQKIDELEKQYDVVILMEAMMVACDIVARYSEAFLSNKGEANGCSPKVMMVLLQEKAAELLHGACARVRQDFDIIVEENCLDEAEHMLYRTLLELNEIKRERDLASQSWIPRTCREGMKIWLRENVAPVLLNMLSENKIKDGLTTIYIDTLAGTYDLSYRLEKSPVNISVFKHFKESLNELRRAYLKEKERAYKIYTLKRKYLELVTMDSDENLIRVMELVNDLVDAVNDLIVKADVNFSCKNYKLTSVNFLNQEAERRQLELAAERARNELDGLQKVWDDKVEGIYRVVDIVAEALLRTIHGPCDTFHFPAKSFLILGLESAGKADLWKGLAELCATNVGTSVIQINVEEHKDSDSLLQLMGRAFWHDSHEQHGLGLQEAVGVKQGCIILIDQIEKAHMSVFSTIISMLDHSAVEDSRGRKIDFRDSVIAIMSDLGNRHILSRLSGHPCGGSVETGCIKQDGEHFRTELLNRVDEILIFDPLAEKQLENFSRLPMRAGRHLEGDHYELFCAFLSLFKNTTQSDAALFAVSHLSKGLIGKCSNAGLLSSLGDDQDHMQPATELIGECSSIVSVS